MTSLSEQQMCTACLKQACNLFHEALLFMPELGCTVATCMRVSQYYFVAFSCNVLFVSWIV